MNDVRPYGRRAFLVTPGDGASPAGLAGAVQVERPQAVLDVVPAAATVLVTLAETVGNHERDEIGAWLTDLVAGTSIEAAREISIDVMYDGADLAGVAQASGLDVDEVVRRHVEVAYRCEFCGFAPGFAYLSGLDPALHLPRRSTPRTSVPAGSLAIAGPYTAVYPSPSPGGWHVLGHTDAVLWDTAVTPPSSITPGTIVRFRPSGRSPLRSPQRSPSRSSANEGAPALEVVAPGWSTSVQDDGRPGLAHLGVPASGAVDAGRRRLLNRLLGNPPDAAVLETAGGLALRAVAPVVVADSSSGAVTTLAIGDTVRVDPAPGETWATLAIRGGVAVVPVLGSRSADSRSGIGSVALAAGDIVALYDDPRTPIETVLAPSPRIDRPVRVSPGPRVDWFTDAAAASLTTAHWTVSDDVSRVGVRLQGPVLGRAVDAATLELPSEGLVLGAIQVPPNGLPIVMLADHPTTGGYPVIAVVDERDLDVVVRSGPGAAVRFRWV